MLLLMMTLDRVVADGAAVYRTDVDGAVELAIRKDGGYEITGGRWSDSQYVWLAWAEKLSRAGRL